MVTAKRKRHLDAAKTIALGDWLRDNRGRIERDGPTIDEVAMQASEALDFEVSVSNLRRVQAAVRVAWNVVPKSGRYRDREAEILAQRLALRDLVEEFGELVEKLEEPKSPRLERLEAEFSGDDE